MSDVPVEQRARRGRAARGARARLGRRAARRRAPTSELDAMRHSTAHVMAEAVLDLFPGTKLGIGPAIHDGFYYDFELPRPLTPDDLGGIEARMAESVAADHPFVRHELPPDDGRAFFVAQRPALQGRDPRRPRGTGGGRPASRCRRPRLYEHGPFIDLCKGPHVASTGRIGPFKLLSVAGAYWRGDEKRPMLQRIYGTVWPTQEELDAVPLAARRGAASATTAGSASSSTCTASTTCRPGSAFWHPKGQRIWRTLEGAMRELQDRHGYEEVSHADPRQPPALAAVRPLGPLPRQHVRARHRGPDRTRSSR